MIVLPEGFNLGQGYYDKRYGRGTEGASDVKIIADLKVISHKYGCAFVAGLIVADCPNVAPPHNSAYSIDRDSDTVLSRKHGVDSSANYTPYPQYSERPAVCRNVAVVALMCMDSYEGTDRFQALAEKMREAHASIVCIPMHMSNGLGGGNPGHKLTCRYGLGEAVWIGANSNVGCVNSFVADCDGVIKEQVCGGAVAKIEVVPLADLIAKS
ncbi:MAG TPA: hypothetical protein VGN17_02055 [Bryobacteraceae bacterium]